MSESAVTASTHEADGPVIVVGVDGSAASLDALKWAANYAAMSGGELRALIAWQWPVSLGVALQLPEDFSPLDDAKLNLAQSITEALGERPAVSIVSEVVEGAPAGVLVEASKTGALLVVGSRGHGGFAELLMGSTSEHCTRHAACPVVVVRHQKNAA